jgi:zinc transporter ZupT
MTLISILVGTLVAGMGSVWLAALLAYALLSRFTQHLLSLAAGALLATAFTRLLPEAFELSVAAGVSAQAMQQGLSGMDVGKRIEHARVKAISQHPMLHAH